MKKECCDGQRDRRCAMASPRCTSTTGSRKAAAQRCCRCAAGVVADTAASGAARALFSGVEPAHGALASEDLRCKWMRWSCCLKSLPRPRDFTQAFSGAARIRDCADADCRCAPLRAHGARSIRRDRGRQFSSGAQRFRSAVHRGALRGSARRGWLPGGLFCQWLPLHQLDLETCAASCAAFEVYPHGWAMLATNSLETPVIGWSRTATENASLKTCGNACATVKIRGRDSLASSDDLALLGSFIAVRIRLRYSRRCTAQHR